MSWQFIKYGGDSDLIQSDLSRFRGKEFEVIAGDELALLVKFTLKSSQYATMALRELTKCETGSGMQANMSSKANAEKEKVAEVVQEAENVAVKIEKRSADDMENPVVKIQKEV
jgi:tRNA pseudouridine13 synthase